jgi:hypothetical protein
MSARAKGIAAAVAVAVAGLAALGPDVDVPAKERWESSAGLVERLDGAHSKGGT